MIGKLTGIIDSIFDEYLILDVNGVGYIVFVSQNILDGLIIGEKLSLIIETSIKEDSITLYGFLNNNEKLWFNILCKISGVGGKMSLKIMGSLTIEEVVAAVESGNTQIFSKVSGIGSKLSSRILTELKDIRKNTNLIIDNVQISDNTINLNKNDTRLKDALSALENLGYHRNSSYNILIEILKEKEDIVLESLITEALKKINNY